MVCLPGGEKIEDSFIRFDKIHERDRRIDGHRTTAYWPRLRIASLSNCRRNEFLLKPQLEFTTRNTLQQATLKPGPHYPTRRDASLVKVRAVWHQLNCMSDGSNRRHLPNINRT